MNRRCESARLCENGRPVFEQCPKFILLTPTAFNHPAQGFRRRRIPWVSKHDRIHNPVRVGYFRFNPYRVAASF
jgi:hypothetical protein